MKPRDSEGDAELVRRSLTGDTQAFDALTRRHQGMVESIITRHACRPGNDASDLAQQAFITAYRKLEKLKDPSRFEAWLWGITSRLCWKWSGRRRDEARVLELPATEISDRPEGDPFVREELRHRIAHAIAGLAPEYQEVLLLRYLEELDQDEIATITDRTVGSVRGILQRGTKLLRDQLVSVWNELYPQHHLDTGAELPARIEELLSSGQTAVMVIAEDHTIVAVNTPYSQNFGFAAEQVVGRKCFEISHGRTSPCSGTEHPCPMDLIGKGARQVAVVHRHRNPLGEEEEVDIVTMPVEQELTSGRRRRFHVEELTPRSSTPRSQEASELGS